MNIPLPDGSELGRSQFGWTLYRDGHPVRSLNRFECSFIDSAIAACTLSSAGRFLPWSPEETAKRFHDAYELFAPAFGWTTQANSRKPWADLQASIKNLMIAVVRNVLIEQAGATQSANTSTSEWIKWRGGKCPVDPHAMVEYRCGDGTVHKQAALALDWKRDDTMTNSNIVAYRLVDVPDRETKNRG